jgi:sigma54-dependent transcription regulator
MSVKPNTVDLTVEIKNLDPDTFKNVYAKLMHLRASVYTQPSEDFIVTLKGEKIRV